MKKMRLRQQQILLQVLALLVALSSGTCTCSASTAPWYQRKPKPPSPTDNKGTADDSDEQNIHVVTKRVPGWLQRATNRTEVETPPKEPESPKRKRGVFFFSSRSSVKNETASTTASSKKDLPKPSKETNSPETEKKQTNEAEDESSVEKTTMDKSAEPATTTTNGEQVAQDLLDQDEDDPPKDGLSGATGATVSESSSKPPGDQSYKQRPRWLQRLQNRGDKPNEAPQPVEATPNSTSSSETSTSAAPQSNQTLTSTESTSSAATSANSTSSERETATPNQNQPQPSPETQQQQQQRIIVMKPQPSGNRYNYVRGVRPSLYPSQPQQQPGFPTGLPTGPGTSPVAEVLGQLLGTALRVYLLTWMTKKLATQEEAMVPATQHYCWEGLNDKFQRDAQALQTAVRTPPLGVSNRKWKRLLKERRLTGSAEAPSRTVAAAGSRLYDRTVVVVELNTGGGGSGGDASASIGLEHLADVVSFLLLQQRRRAFGSDAQTGAPLPLEVVLLVNSPGGAVSTYGLAAAQMRRLKSTDCNIVTTVCVDKVAASGGYMIASQADKLVAAPFASLGSVGVIMEGLNFNELARRSGVHPLVIKAGESKNPISTMGPVNKKDLEDTQEDLEKVHAHFIELVVEGRPGLARQRLSTILDGSVFLGKEAKELGLVDAIGTTDEYLLERISAGDRVLRLHRSFQHRFSRRPLHIMDILPHLRAWANRVMTMFGESGGAEAGGGWKDFSARFVQVGSWVGFAHHIVSKYAGHQKP